MLEPLPPGLSREEFENMNFTTINQIETVLNKTQKN